MRCPKKEDYLKRVKESRGSQLYLGGDELLELTKLPQLNGFRIQVVNNLVEAKTFTMATYSDGMFDSFGMSGEMKDALTESEITEYVITVLNTSNHYNLVRKIVKNLVSFSEESIEKSRENSVLGYSKAGTVERTIALPAKLASFSKKLILDKNFFTNLQNKHLKFSDEQAPFETRTFKLPSNSFRKDRSQPVNKDPHLSSILNRCD